jgi:hypothetical protein
MKNLFSGPESPGKIDEAASRYTVEGKKKAYGAAAAGLETETCARRCRAPPRAVPGIPFERLCREGPIPAEGRFAATVPPLGTREVIMSSPHRHETDSYLTIDQACALAAISRTSFYKLLDDPGSGLAEVAVRIPGLHRIRVLRRKFCQWLESCPAKPQRKK